MSRRRRSGGWLTEQTGGMPHWGIVASALIVLVILAWALISIPQKVVADPHGELRPVPTFTQPSAPVTIEPRAVFIGDSYTAGAGSTSGEGFVALVSSEQGWVATNLGVGGTGYITTGEPQDPASSKIACGLDYCPNYGEVIQAAVDADPSVVVVGGGRNNGWADSDLLSEHVNRFYTDLRAVLPDARIIAVSPIWDDDEAPEFIHELREIVQTAATSIGAEYIDIGEPLFGDGALVTEDGVHPSDAGYSRIADAINSAITR